MRVNLQDDEAVDVQMAPLIDCVFLLLIFFLVATTLKKTTPELPIDLPISSIATEVAQDPGRLVLGVDSAGHYYVGGTRVTNELLQTTLKDAAAQNPDQEVRLDVDRRVPFQHVIQLVELCTFVGLNNVGFQTAVDSQ